MELRFQLADSTDLDAFSALARWYRNPEIKYAIRPNFDEAEMPDMTAEQIAAGYCSKNKLAYFIYDHSSLIGEVTIETHFPMLHRSIEKTGWVSVVIGEPEYWRKGVGSAAMRFLEDTCRSIGMQRIELGVFAFNERAICMYQKLGYTEFGRIARFTYQSGRWYDDIRMEKWL